MYGAILGDIIGSPYEFDHNNIKTKDFPLFSKHSEFTDDSVLTLAIAEAVMQFDIEDGFEALSTLAESSMRKWGKKYPHAGYGIRFANWLFLDGREPYNSLGNGSAMRVSPVAWAFDDIDTVRKAAVAVTIPTHNHPEGVKGAEAVASAIFLARKGHSKDEIKAYIEQEFGYDLSRTCDEIRPYYRHDETCMRTVPEAITAFLEGESFEDVIRTAVSLGGDSDTLTAIAGSIAEGFYGISDELKSEAVDRLDAPLRIVLCKFDIMLNGCPEPDVDILKELML